MPYVADMAPPEAIEERNNKHFAQQLLSVSPNASMMSPQSLGAVASSQQFGGSVPGFAAMQNSGPMGANAISAMNYQQLTTPGGGGPRMAAPDPSVLANAQAGLKAGYVSPTVANPGPRPDFLGPAKPSKSKEERQIHQEQVRDRLLSRTIDRRGGEKQFDRIAELERKGLLPKGRSAQAREQYESGRALDGNPLEKPQDAAPPPSQQYITNKGLYDTFVQYAPWLANAGPGLEAAMNTMSPASFRETLSALQRARGEPAFDDLASPLELAEHDQLISDTEFLEGERQQYYDDLAALGPPPKGGTDEFDEWQKEQRDAQANIRKIEAEMKQKRLEMYEKQQAVMKKGQMVQEVRNTYPPEVVRAAGGFEKEYTPPGTLPDGNFNQRGQPAPPDPEFEQSPSEYASKRYGELQGQPGVSNAEARQTAQREAGAKRDAQAEANAQVNEKEFQSWYKGYSKQYGLSDNPDDPEHHYDYRGAYASGAQPDSAGHMPSEFKRPGHPNRFVDGIDTITGKPIPQSTNSVVYDLDGNPVYIIDGRYVYADGREYKEPK